MLHLSEEQSPCLFKDFAMNILNIKISGRTLFLCYGLAFLILVSCQSDHEQDSNQKENDLPYPDGFTSRIIGQLLHGIH